ncbi:MAG: hypothetical protein WBK95_04725 [Sulfurimonas sp.]|nr:hypothetical protein [Sulfurimonas sp.]
MVKFLTLLTLFFLHLSAQSDFDKNCMSCHGDDFKFYIIMKKYTLKYSSATSIKKAMFAYLKNPTLEASILPPEYKTKFGIKEKSDLNDETLKQMIDIYYDKYNLASKLK